MPPTATVSVDESANNAHTKEAVRAQLASGELVLLHIDFDPEHTNARDVVEALREGGATVSLYKGGGKGQGPGHAEETAKWRFQFTASCYFTVPVFLISMVLPHIPGVQDSLDEQVTLTIPSLTLIGAGDANYTK